MEKNHPKLASGGRESSDGWFGERGA